LAVVVAVLPLSAENFHKFATAIRLATAKPPKSQRTKEPLSKTKPHPTDTSPPPPTSELFDLDRLSAKINSQGLFAIYASWPGQEGTRE